MTGGAPLLDAPREVSHGGVEGSMALLDDTLAVAYHDLMSSAQTELVVVVDGAERRFPVGRAERARPLLARTGAGFAVLAPEGPEDGVRTSRRLRLRCDL